MRVTADSSYRTLSISGYANPTNIVTDRFSDSRLLDAVIVEDWLGGTETRYEQQWIDHAQLFYSSPPGGPVVLQQQWKALFDSLPFGPLPVVPWDVVVGRVYELGEIEFLRTFVTSVPPLQRFTVTASSSDS